MKICFVITGTNTGGAEIMLAKLVENLDAQFEARIISMVPIGEIGERLRSKGIVVETLNMTPSVPNPVAVWKLQTKFKTERPDIVHTWMYHADLLGGLAARIARVPSVVWGIRHSNFGSPDDKRLTKFTARVCALLSRTIPDAIVCCSQVARDHHVAAGYDATKMTVIPNGFDLDQFIPNELKGTVFREANAIPLNVPLIGMVGRYHAQKNHIGFLDAAKLIQKEIPETRFLLAGEGCDIENLALKEKLLERGLFDSFHLLGRVSNMEQLYPALDVLVSASVSGEAFPNVIAEAMSCGVNCVATDVGDSALIVGSHGAIVAPGNVRQLALETLGILKMPKTERTQAGLQGRRYIRENFNLERIVGVYSSLYAKCLVARGRNVE